jgi:hypothetical protein
MKEARIEDKSSFGWAKAALGLTLAAGALTGCVGEPVPPAPDPGAYEIDSPEVVVLSDSVQRIDLSREQERECTGFGEDESCSYVDVAYHAVGIHMGEGIVQDLNGNLFAAPQIVAPGSPGIAVANPDYVFVDGPLGSEGTLTKTDNGIVTGGSIFGRARIEVSDNEAVVMQKALFGGEYETMRVTTNNGVGTVSERRWDQQVVQSQGEHILVQTDRGHKLAEVRHNEDNNTYKVTKDALFRDYEVTVTYGPDAVNFETNTWGSDSSVSRSRNSSGNEQFQTKDGAFRRSTVTVREDGWNEKYHGLFGGSLDYTVRGGETLPQ